MARAWSPRPLTPGVVTIWYRAPEILLGAKNYASPVDIWSAGLVLGELLLSSPCLPGDTNLEQLAWIVKLLGSPTADDLAALSAIGCPELVRWRREGLTSGRADNIERKFGSCATAETLTMLRGLLRWDPRARWTAAEALGSGSNRFAEMAEKWWRESPRAVDKGLLPTYPEVRNRTQRSEQSHGSHNEDRGTDEGYVFDFGESRSAGRSLKRAREP